MPVKSQTFDKKAIEKQLKTLSPAKQKKFLDSVANAHAQEEIMEGIPYLDFCINYAWKNKFDNSRIAHYFYRRATLFRKTGEYTRALSDYARAEQIYFEEKDNAGLQSVYSGYGGLYSRIGEHLKSIKYIRLALEKAEITRNEDEIGVSYNDLGTVYRNMKLYDSATHFYHKAKEIYLKKNGYYGAALILDNISQVFTERNMLDSAAYYNDMAFEMSRPLKNTFLELQLLFNACGISEKNKNYETQLWASQRAKYLADSLKIPFYQMMCDGNYAVALKNNNRQREALQIFRNISGSMKQSGDYGIMENFYGEMSALFASMGQSDSALFYFKQAAAIRDSLDKAAEKGRVSEIIARFSLDEKEKSIQNLKKQQSVEQEKSQLKSIVIWVAAGMMVIVVVLLIIIVLRLRENRKLTKEVSEKNETLAQKQEEILDSINYARQIQYSLLTNTELLEHHLAEHFILYLPKDIVSGDFYWATSAKASAPNGHDSFYLAVCDSTGHGVPGAFMSLLNISFLNEAINEKKLERPNEVLDHVRQRLVANMEGGQDGMDATLVRFEKNKVTYASAHNRPVLVRNNTCIELQADKMPVGKSDRMQPFALHTVDVNPGEMMYFFTDGFADQFGGPAGKKYKYANLNTFFLEIQGLSMPQQQQRLKDEFLRWKGSLEQIDDVCVVGIRYKLNA